MVTRPIRVHGDDRAHLLERVDEVLDLRLNGGVLEPRDALCHDGGEQQLLGGADGRVGQRVLDAVQPVGRAEVQAVCHLRDDGAELVEDVEVEVDGPVADAATTEVGDYRLAKPVQQRAAQQDRDARRAGVLGDVNRVGGRQVAGVDREDAGRDVVVNARAVESQAGLTPRRRREYLEHCAASRASSQAAPPPSPC